MCKLVYQIHIKIYKKISILRNCSKVKLCRAVSQGLGLKGVKIIAQNVANFGMHDCLSNGHPNLWSSFDSKKYVKNETPSYNFVMVWLKGAENNSKHHEIWCTHLSSKSASKDMIKFWLREICKKWNFVVRFRKGWGLKGVKIARNIAKFGIHDFLSNGHPNLWSSFDSKKYVKIELPSYSFVRIWLKGVENNSEHRESWRAHLSSKCTSKGMIKF